MDGIRRGLSPGYAELQVTTNFSFLRGGSHPHELVIEAARHGLTAMGVADRNTLAGVVRAHLAARELGLRIVVGARLDLQDAPSLLCFPTDRDAYGRLSRLLSLGQGRADKGACILYLDDVAAHASGQIFIAIPPQDWDWREALNMNEKQDDKQQTNVIPLVPHYTRPPHDIGSLSKDSRLDAHATDLTGRFQKQLEVIQTTLTSAPLYLAASHGYRGDDRTRIGALAKLADRCGLPLIATNDVLYHTPGRRPLQDVLTCIREKTTIREAGFLLEANAERHIKSPAEIARLFRGYEEAIVRTVEIADACQFSLEELCYEYPEEPVPAGHNPQSYLRKISWEGARWRFPNGIPDNVQASLKKELALIEELKYAPYFLTVYDIVHYARSQGILCQGRGSAANSV
ncbi:MAG: PHP domain-containing protein, partial [Pseudomonadota bacterium]